MAGSDAPGFDPQDLRDLDRRELERDIAQESRILDAMEAAFRRERQERLAMPLPPREDPMERFRRADRESVRRLMEVVNDPAITIDKDTVDAINDPEVVMTPNGDVARVTRRGLGTGAFAAQFNRGMGFDLPKTNRPKRKRKKNPKLAAAFREANRRYRTKSGKLRKGRTQADIARLAHRLLKRM